MSRHLVEFVLTGLIAALLTHSSTTMAQPRELNVVQTLDLSNSANIGKDFSSGLRAVLDSVNARGGIRGKRINLFQLDDGGRAADAAANINKLVQDYDPVAIIGPTQAETLAAVIDSGPVRAGGRVVLGAATGAGERFAGNPRFFAARAGYRDEARHMLDFAQRTLASEAIVLLRGEGADGDAAAAAVSEEAKARNLRVAHDGKIDGFNLASVAAIRGLCLVVTGDAIAVAAVLRRNSALLWRAHVMAFSTADHQSLHELLGGRGAGIVLTQAMPPPQRKLFPFQREHQAQMKAFRDEAPSLHSLEGYVVGKLLIAALERIDGEPTAAKLQAALRSLPPAEFGPLRIDLRPGGEAPKFVNLTMLSRHGALID